MPENPEHKAFHVRVTRIHATGGATSRDVDIRDREHWKRLVRGAKETLEQGGEHHMRPLYQDDSPATSVPAPLKLRVEALEEGIREMVNDLHGFLASASMYYDAGYALKKLEALLPKKSETKEAGN